MGEEAYVEQEATGVYKGTLLEDMVDTVSRTGRLYCDVMIHSYFREGFPHPLTLVPLWAFMLPLRKGDKVLVRFKDHDYSRPYLWREQDELPGEMHEDFSFPQGPSGGNTAQPDSGHTVGAVRLGDGAYVIKTDSYVLVRQGDAFSLMDTDGNIYVQGNDVQVAANGDLVADAGGDCKVHSEGKCEVSSKGDCTVDSKGKCGIRSDGDCTIDAGSACTVTARGECKVNASGGVLLNNHLRVTA